MSSRLRRGSMLAAAAAVLVYPLLPSGIGKDVFFDVFGALSVAAMVVGTLRNARSDRLPWLLLAAGQGLFVLGDLAFNAYEHVLHSSPFPSAADGLYLAGYPVLAAGLLLLVRRRRPGEDAASLLDAGLVTVGLGSISWIVLIAPYLQDRSLSWAGVVISAAYPLGDVLLLAVAARLLFGGGRRSPSLLLIGASLLALLSTDSIYGWLNLHDRYSSGDLLDVGWLVSYGLFAFAAMHPSMGSVSERDHVLREGFPAWRFALLGVATATVPAGVVVEGLRGGIHDGVVYGVAGVMLIAIVLVRFAGVIRDDERSIRREMVLREAGVALARASGIEAIHTAGLRAALSLTTTDRDASAVLAFGRPDELVFTAGEGVFTERLTESLLSLRPDARRQLAEGLPVDLRDSDAPGSGRAETTTRMFPLFRGDEFRGVIGVEAAGPISSGEGLALLAEQISLALEMQILAEREARGTADRIAAERSAKTKDHFVSQVSHELRTPLTSIRGYLELLRTADEDGVSTADRAKYLEVVDRNAERLLGLVEDLLLVAQMDDTGFTLEKTACDLAELTSEAVEAARPAADKRRITLRARGESTLPLLGDRNRLTQVIDNLLSNALKFTPEGGEVTIEAARSNGNVRVVVADTGVGMRPDEVPHLFERFYRTDAATTRAIQGTGLGLSIAKAIVEAHGGTIAVESRLGVGTSMTIDLPAGR